MSITAQEASLRLFLEADLGVDDVEANRDAGLVPIVEVTTVKDDSQSLADRIWQAVVREVPLGRDAGSAGEESRIAET